MTLPIVLASTSPWRLAMLRAAGIPCEGVAPRADESTVRDTDPDARARGRAVLKAYGVQRPDAIVIAADQVAHLDGECFGKPRDAADHLARLQSLRGRLHTLSTGVCIRAPGRPDTLFVEHSALLARADLSDAELAAYVASGEGSACAGGYAIEGRGAQLFARVDGDHFNVIGLPLLRVIDSLRALGWRPDLRGLATE
ncbi:MAG: septum formation protein Maf [Pseudomonadota bacterium]|jgi:septum formation protein